MSQSAVSSVVGRIGNLVVQESSLLCAVTSDVAFLKEELERLQGFLKDADNQMRSGHESVAVCVWQLRDASYEAENVIEAAEYIKKRSMLKRGFMGAISRYARLPSDLVALHKVDAQIRRVRRKISEIKDSMSSLNIANIGFIGPEDIGDDDVHIPLNCEDDAVVGFEGVFREIVGKLVNRDDENLRVVSLVAMGGAGKTTVARQVYNSSKVKQYFDIVAWVTVSQKFKSIDLLKDILMQITGASHDQIHENEVRKKIHDFLLHKRYLVVLDDVWETNTWEQINTPIKVFPDTDKNNGSKVLLTTRKEDVAHHIQMPTYVHDLQLLNEKDSWELFSNKALPSYKISTICNLDEFKKLGRKLARKCDGLPLALAVLGGYLSKNLNIEAWSDLLLDWTSTRDGQMMGAILARSYKDLSNRWLKSCFLYLASFPEDYCIPVPDLIELWIAECFIPHRPRHTLEETAQRYLTDLVQRNLVQVGWKATIDSFQFPAIKIHDILRDWCIEEARRDGFLSIFDKNSGQVGASSSDTMACYRSCFHNFYGDDGYPTERWKSESWDVPDQIIQATPNLRTLIGFGLSALLLPKLRFLKVLHLENSTVENLKLIRGCIHLRYLRLRCCKGDKLPSSIGQLPYLQTIDLRSTNSGLRTEPYPEQLSVRSSLGSMLPITVCTIPTLRHLYFDNGLTGQPEVMKVDPMHILEKLPCLVVLYLPSYHGPATMSCSAQGFPQLQELALGLFDIVWMLEVGAMPRLSCLKLFTLPTSLPEGLVHLPSLKKLLVRKGNDMSSDNTWNELKKKGCKFEVME